MSTNNNIICLIFIPIVNNYYVHLSITTQLGRILFMNNRSLYEKYHKNIKLQKKVILMNDFTYKNTLKRIDKFIPKKGNALDIGSATGTISFYITSRGLIVDGIELSKNAILNANLNKTALVIKNVNFINTSIEKYNSSKEYDLIVCFEVLEHIVNDLNCLKMINRFMKKNSIFAISVPSVNAPLYKLGYLTNFDRKVGHLRRYSMSTIKALLNRSGFIIIEEFKTEGLVRSIFFTNSVLGLCLKLARFKMINNILSYLDDITLKLFSESQLILICKKG